MSNAKDAVQTCVTSGRGQDYGILITRLHDTLLGPHHSLDGRTTVSPRGKADARLSTSCPCASRQISEKDPFTPGQSRQVVTAMGLDCL